MVGCKYNQGYINKKRACTELIDTWWDVNVFRDVMEYGGYIELIDTQWDVNNNEYENDYISLEINRYIVGCKLT